jgi:hypothetical protein
MHTIAGGLPQPYVVFTNMERENLVGQPPSIGDCSYVKQFKSEWFTVSRVSIQLLCMLDTGKHSRGGIRL